MKGATVFATLREQVGDGPFFKGLRSYASEFAFKKSGIADLRKIFEKESGLDLKDFFRQWIHAPGYPHLKIEAVDAKKEQEEFRVSVRVAQQQSPPFSLQMEIAFHGEGGRLAVRKAEIEEDTETVEEMLFFEPVRVVLDPNNQILKHPGPDNEWEKQ
jgi:aminopeptidase N